MIRIQSTGSTSGSSPVAATSRRIASWLVLLAGLVLSAAPNAQSNVSAVPEFIALTEADLETPVGAELASAQEAFRTSLTDDPAQALEIAKTIVALTAEAYGESHEYVAQALTNLAIVQAENANFGAAIENYVAAIRSRERASGTIVAPELVNPLRGLASAYVAADQAERAIPMYERAIHISHVNDGPNNLDQIELIDALSRAYFFEGDLDTADDMQDAVYRLRERHFGNNPDQMIDALAYRAAWYSRLGNRIEAVQSYRRVEREISQKHGSDDVRLIEPLIALGNEAILIPDGGDLALTEGKRAIARAVGIARIHGRDDPELLARTLVEQGDWLASINLNRESRRPYREAWNLLESDPELHAIRDELFAVPVPLTRVRMRPVYGERSWKVSNLRRFPQRGYADVGFDVSPMGRPTNVRILRASPPGLMDAHVRRQIRRFRYRPAFRDGQPATYTNVKYRHTFRYAESELTEKDQEIIAATRYPDAEPAVPGATPAEAADRERDEPPGGDTNESTARDADAPTAGAATTGRRTVALDAAAGQTDEQSHDR